MNGKQTISVYNVCEDSLLASALIIDLVLLGELMTRVTYAEGPKGQHEPMYSIMSTLSYMCKAPLVRPGTAVINGLGRQRAAIEHFLRATLGLQPLSEVRSLVFDSFTRKLMLTCVYTLGRYAQEWMELRKLFTSRAFYECLLLLLL